MVWGLDSVLCPNSCLILDIVGGAMTCSGLAQAGCPSFLISSRGRCVLLRQEAYYSKGWFGRQRDRGPCEVRLSGAKATVGAHCRAGSGRSVPSIQGSSSPTILWGYTKESFAPATFPYRFKPVLARSTALTSHPSAQLNYTSGPGMNPILKLGFGRVPVGGNSMK